MYTKLIQLIFCKTHMPYASAIPTKDLHNIHTFAELKYAAVRGGPPTNNFRKT